jgi:hypothetical protein
MFATYLIKNKSNYLNNFRIVWTKSRKIFEVTMTIVTRPITQDRKDEKVSLVPFWESIEFLSFLKPEMTLNPAVS